MTDNTTPTNDDSKIIAFGKRFEDTKPQEPKHVAKTWWFDWKNSNDQLELTTLEGFIRFNPPYITIIPEYMETSGINDSIFAVSMERLSGFGQIIETQA